MTTVTATMAKQNFGNCLLNSVKEPIVIERSGKPTAVLLSYEEFKRLVKLENDMLMRSAIEAAREGFLDEQENAEWFAKMNERFNGINQESE